MADLTPLATLLRDAAEGDQRAWDQLVDRYAGLVVAVARRYRLSQADLADVSQTVWLRVVENLGLLREPEALPGWLVTTTRNECLRVVRAAGRLVPAGELERLADGPDLSEDVSAGLLHAERQEAVREAMWSLPERCRELFELLLSDPPVPYDVIGRRLSMPHGSIGPTRSRCLDRLRAAPAVAALLSDTQPPARTTAPTRGGGSRGVAARA